MECDRDFCFESFVIFVAPYLPLSISLILFIHMHIRTQSKSSSVTRLTVLAAILLLQLKSPKLAAAQDFRPASAPSGLERAYFGHGAAVADYDNDGWLDVYLVSKTPYSRTLAGSANMLFRNLGDGSFKDMAEFAGVRGTRDTTRMANSEVILNYGATWADYDNDGDADLFLTNKGTNVLYENLGDGIFADMTADAGLNLHFRESTSAAWFDYDRDGDLDLHISNYQQYGVIPSSDNVLYENQNDGTFIDVTDIAGVQGGGFGSADMGFSGITYCTLVLDADLDGWPDLYQVNDFGYNVLFINQKNGAFVEATAAYGLEDSGHGMGATLGDFDNDGLLDVYLTNIADDLEEEWSPLFRRTGSGTYQDVTKSTGTGITNWAWGCEFLDYDLDGDLDIYVVNGNLGNDYRNYFFRNEGNGAFADISELSGTDSDEEARGLAVADFNNDGRLDMFVANWRAPAQLYLNHTTTGSYLKVNLIGQTSNRDAYGAIVRLEAEGQKLMRVNDGVEFLGQSKTPLHFGLSTAQSINRMTIEWPSGQVQTLDDLAVNQTVTIVEGQGIVTALDSENPPAPGAFALHNPSPNPVRSLVTLRFSLPKPGYTSLVIYDLLGRQVRRLEEKQQPAGLNSVRWDGRDQQRRLVPEGVYFARLTFSGATQHQKLIVLR